MANYTAWSAVELTTELKWWKSRFDDPFARDKRKIETRLKKLTSELDRRCQIFEWDEGRVCIKPTNDFVTVHQTLWIEDNEPMHNIKDYYIEAPHEFAALLSYFTSKSRT